MFGSIWPIQYHTIQLLLTAKHTAFVLSINNNNNCIIFLNQTF